MEKELQTHTTIWGNDSTTGERAPSGTNSSCIVKANMPMNRVDGINPNYLMKADMQLSLIANLVALKV